MSQIFFVHPPNNNDDNDSQPSVHNYR